MRTKLALVSICIIVFSMFGISVLAAPDIGIGDGGMAQKVGKISGFETNVDDTTLSQSIGLIIRVALSLTGTIFLVLAIYAGILWMTAQGNEEQVTKSTNIIKMATIGFIIVLAAYSLTTFVLMALSLSTGMAKFPAESKQAPASYGQRFWAAFSAPFTRL